MRVLERKGQIEEIAARIALVECAQRSGDMMPHEEGMLDRPTQLLALLIKSSGSDGFMYLSAVGSGANIVLFNPDDVEIAPLCAGHASGISPSPLAPYFDVYEERPYDFAPERE